MKFILQNANDNKWIIDNIKKHESEILEFKEAIKRFSAMLPYARKASEGHFGHLLGWDAEKQCKYAIEDMERRIKEREKWIKQGKDELKKQ